MDLPIVIDNGSYKCRAGFAGDEAPRLIFRNHVVKLRREKGKNKDVEIQVGNEIENVDAVRFALKTQFDRNVVVHMEMQENVFDYIFTSLNIQSEGSLHHPVVLTEAYLNPNYCRHLMSELLFECYNVPSIAYGVDCLHSLAKNAPHAKDALIISLGYKTIEVIPYIDGNIDPVNSRRINLGGYEITNFLHKLLQLKYPAHGSTLTLSKIEEILHSNCSISEDYFEDLRKWAGIEYYNEHVLKIQGPKKPPANGSQLENIKERRKELSKKLTEMNARKREERLAEDEERLVILNEIKESIETEENPSEAERALQAAGASTLNELLKEIATLKTRINKSKEKSKPEITPASESPTSSLRQKRSSLSPDITEVREKRSELLKKRSLRRQRKSEMAKRRSLASQEKMRVLSQLAKQEKNDTFGMNDSDWDVYKSIQKDGGSDSNEEQEELNELEDVLKTRDPDFAQEVRDDDHELHIGLESIRAAEIIFQPSMIGEPQAGIVETIDHVLKLYPGPIQDRLVSKVFVTGNIASFKGLLPRLNKELMEIRPFESTFEVQFAKDPELDPWNNMSSWAADPLNRQFFISKVEYEEYGSEYLKQHPLSNTYFASPNQSHYSTIAT